MAAFDILAAAKARFLGASTTADQIGRQNQVLRHSVT
jgi:hypothetical protein